MLFSKAITCLQLYLPYNPPGHGVSIWYSHLENEKATSTIKIYNREASFIV